MVLRIWPCTLANQSNQESLFCASASQVAASPSARSLAPFSRCTASRPMAKNVAGMPCSRNSEAKRGTAFS